jgi:hypothetical protein
VGLGAGVVLEAYAMRGAFKPSKGKISYCTFVQPVGTLGHGERTRLREDTDGYMDKESGVSA